MKRTILIIAGLFSIFIVSAQNVGIGIPMPDEKLEVDGNLKAIGLILITGVAQYDFLMKNNSDGHVGFRKGHGALGIHYMIATNGFYPSEGPPANYADAFIGEIKLFTGNIIPNG